MSTRRSLLRVARAGAIALRNLARGWPLVYTGTAAMTLDDDDLTLAAALLADRRGWMDEAPVAAFERQFADWNGNAAACAFASGRIALRQSLDALGLQPGDEVVLPGYTCVVVPNALHAAGLHTVYADIELDTYGLDKDALLRALTPRSKAVLIHHLYGYVSRDLDAVLEIARRRGLRVIEDCAQAAGARYHGRHVGTFGDVGIFSLDPSKPFTCVQGGVAVANDEAVIAALRERRHAAPPQDETAIANRLANVSLNYALAKDPQRWWKGELIWWRDGDSYFYGIPDREVAGAAPIDAGCRMSAPLARLASNQLAKLDYYNTRRRANGARWDDWCRTQGFAGPMVVEGSTPIGLRYPVLVTPAMKRELGWAYRTLGVIPGQWFVTHLHPATEPRLDLPNATRAVERCINFPTLYYEDRWRPAPRA
jgi:perosamine synthetase